MDAKLVVKIAITTLVVVGVSEIVKRSPSLGALIASLPYVTIIILIWMHVEGSTTPQIAEHCRGTFWYVLPTLPMFLILPKMLEAKWNFSLSLVLCCMLTSALVLVTLRFVHKLNLPNKPAVTESFSPSLHEDRHRTDRPDQ